MENKNENLLFDLFICQRNFEKSLKNIVKKFGTSKNILEIIFMTYLYKNPGITQYDLWKKFKVEKSHINKIIKKLELENLLELRVTVHGSLSKKNIYLTEKGKEISNFTLKNMSYLKKNILKKHPLVDFNNFVSNVNLLSKFPQEDVM
ncbi:MarR family transcriptional regulator [uncultured Ilyobacter sp.]|uniref:MarR family transcriptional regulator n=1 Tax=uncultured Ilyobacter sp. TaxID=544433 RepID=UPI0029F46EE2|nr:MarR family transcriptional regulator [uncultured Ilyobacter sp.]